MSDTTTTVTLSMDNLWLVREALEKRIGRFREHIDYLNETGDEDHRMTQELVAVMESQIRKHEWLLNVPFEVPSDDDEEN